MKIKILIQKKIDEKRLENMKIHARYFGENSSWLHDKKYGDLYKKMLLDLNII